eukprot:TRINITY_DN2991_c0_g4_i1.p2 TRINITY_DN2991_c0_g4~~TRINITY_DN2991_c0_g4_i1.p2  ORF type:complete len:119 (-),score=26.26 TRINITY_DN2991_c0_g4_i1:67-423(-)
MGAQEGCAMCCLIMSCVAVPLLVFFGYLCSKNSPMMIIPGGEDQMDQAKKGCFAAGGLYFLTAIFCLIFLKVSSVKQSHKEEIAQSQKSQADQRAQLEAEVKLLRSQARRSATRMAEA